MTTTTTLRISVFDLPDLARHKTGGQFVLGTASILSLMRSGAPRQRKGERT
jgi:hypothetical protein